MGKARTAGAKTLNGSIAPFERMLAELSARFVNLPADQVDDAIDDALRRIAALIGADRGQQIRFSSSGEATITHSGALGDAPAVPSLVVTDFYPWGMRCLRDGHRIVIPDVDAMPAEAAVDRARFQRIGVKANLSVPLRVAGRVEGAIAFGCLAARREWPPEIVERVALAADVFANALDHKRTQQGLDLAMQFERLVSEILAALLTAAVGDRDRAIEKGLRDVAQALGAERATLWQHDPGGDFFIKTHRWLAEGVAKPADILRDDRLPWIHSRLVEGRVVRFASHADLPPEANGDTAALAQLSIRGAVIVPLAISGRVVGALSLASASAERAWPDALIPRVTLLGELFATVLARDAAERREQDAQTQAAHAARVGTMGMLAASLVHELTQPLAASLANAQTAADLLAAPAPDIAELRSAIADIVADDRRVGELIQQLRRFLRRGEAERKEIHVRHAIDDALHLVAHDAAERSVAIAVDVDPSLPPVVADRVQIQQVLVNLLSNACDAVAARPVPDPRVTVRACASGDGVAIEVGDNGPGIDDATLAHVFQPFFTTKQKGMGLGLSISRSIVAAHGGKLSVRSAVGRGSVFRLDVPSRVRPVPAAPSRAEIAARASGTVFVVDDDPSMRRALERQLRSAGYDVELFPTAHAFLDHRRGNGAACIVSDVRMPGLSGLDLQASLIDATCDLPIVFVSGHGDVSMTAAALRAGAVNFLSKPFTKEALLAAVAEAMARGRDAAAQRTRHDDVRRRHEALTAREREVFALVAAGLLNKVIADRLGAAEATIKIHRGRVMDKMNAGSVADLVRMAEALGIVVPLPAAR
jgi:FixJ family two-component response regulator/signal transduction histidine kinase